MAKTTSRKTIREAAADECGLVLFCTADSVDAAAKTVTISKLADASPNVEWLRDSYLTKDGDTYRRIRSYDGTKVTLTENLAGLINGDACQIYFMLTPEEMNDLLDRDLQTEMVTQHRTEISQHLGTDHQENGGPGDHTLAFANTTRQRLGDQPEPTAQSYAPHDHVQQHHER